jgi:hypothetical protein
MPIYVYEHPKTKKRIEIVQRMSEPHEYEEGGVKWKRVFESPQASTGATIGHLDPFDRRGFIEKTGKMRNITQGDLWDLSAELSAKRAKKAGKDEIKEKTIKAYEKKTGGKKHPHAK